MVTWMVVHTQGKVVFVKPERMCILTVTYYPISLIVVLACASHK